MPCTRGLFRPVQLAIVCGCCLTLGRADSAEPIPLISESSGIRVDRRVITADDFGGGGNDSWKVTKSTLHGGKQEGVDLITVDNGSIKNRDRSDSWAEYR